MSNFPLTVNVSFAIMAITINFVFAVLIMTRTSRNTAHITFLLICIAVIIWNSAELMHHLIGDRSWSYLALVGSAMLPTLSSHFLVTTVRPYRESKAWIVTAYSFSVILAVSSIFIFFYPSMRWIADSGYWDIAYFILLVPFFLYGIAVMLRALNAVREAEDKSQLRYLLIASMIGLVTVISDHIQTLMIPIPALGHVGSVFYSSILAIGVFKHRTAYDVLTQTRMKLVMLNEMSAGIAHEIRNPLSSIKGAARLLMNKSGRLGADQSQEYLNVITEEVERLDAILTNYQYLTKPLKIEKEAVQVNNVIEKTVRLSEMATAGIGTRMNLSEGLPLTQADPQSLKQVFINLIKNASEACGLAGELNIMTEYCPPWIKITFSDTGPGINPAILPHIFDPFVSTKAGGMGLGLAICRRIIESNGGRMEAENSELKGACFSVFLPADEQR